MTLHQLPIGRVLCAGAGQHASLDVWRKLCNTASHIHVLLAPLAAIAIRIVPGPIMAPVVILHVIMTAVVIVVWVVIIMRPVAKQKGKSARGTCVSYHPQPEQTRK
jgi:hypothetical protein